MDGWIIEIIPDNSDDKTPLYWTGLTFEPEVSKALFYTNLIEVRQFTGSLQSQYVDRSFSILPAKNGVYLSKTSSIF